MSGGDITIRGNTLQSKKREAAGFTKIQFAHEAAAGETGFSLRALNNPDGFINQNPDTYTRAMVGVSPGNILLTNGAGKVLADGIDFVVNGTFIHFMDIVSTEGEIFYGTIDGLRQEPKLVLADGFQMSPSGFLEVDQTSFNLGRNIQIPTGNTPEPIIVMRNRVQSVVGEDWNYVNVGSGYAILIEFTRAGELLPSGDKEFVQVFLNGTIVETEPANQRSEIEVVRGQLDRVTEVLETNLGIDPTNILAGAPSQTDLKAFGDVVLGFQKLLSDLEAKVDSNTTLLGGPVGSVQESMLTEAQFQAQAGSGWILSDGRSVTGSLYHTVTGLTTVPDARGLAIRGKNNGRVDGNQNPDGELGLGIFQSHATAKNGLTAEQTLHTHRIRSGTGAVVSPSDPSARGLAALNVDNGWQDITGATIPYIENTDPPITIGAGDNETRMRNLTLNIFIRIN